MAPRAGRNAGPRISWMSGVSSAMRTSATSSTTAVAADEAAGTIADSPRATRLRTGMASELEKAVRTPAIVVATA